MLFYANIFIKVIFKPKKSSIIILKKLRKVHTKTCFIAISKESKELRRVYTKTCLIVISKESRKAHMCTRNLNKLPHFRGW